MYKLGFVEDNYMKDNFVFSKGSFFHGTKAALKIGDFLIIGQKKNYNDDRKSEYVYFATCFESLFACVLLGWA